MSSARSDVGQERAGSGVIAWAIMFGYARQTSPASWTPRAQRILEGAVPVAPHPSADSVRTHLTTAAENE